MEKELVNFLRKELSNSYNGTQYHKSVLYLLSGKEANNRDLMDLCRNLKHQYEKLLVTENSNPYSRETQSAYCSLHYFRRELNAEVQKLL